MVNTNNAFSNKINLFYFQKEDKNHKIFSGEISQIYFNDRTFDDYLALVDFDELQAVTYLDEKEKKVKIRVVLISLLAIRFVVFSIDKNDPNVLNQKKDPIF